MTATEAVDAGAKGALESFLAGLQQCLSSLDIQIAFVLEIATDHVRIEIDGPDSDCFLQRKAEGLNALQHILRRSLEKRIDARREIPIILDSCGYRKMREAELREMARLAGDRVASTGAEMALDPLNPYERRIVHLACQEIGTVQTRSVGNGFYKQVIISPRKKA